MSISTRSFIALISVVFALSAIGGMAETAKSAPASASSNSAVVVNHGQQVGDNCTARVDAIGWFGIGFITHFVLTPSGIVNVGCQLWGPPVPQTMDLNGLRIDPSGHATLSENGA